MRAKCLDVQWHNSQGKKEAAAIFSAHFQPKLPSSAPQPAAPLRRLVTGGQDATAIVWNITADLKVEYLATLEKHTQIVNVVRFAPSGKDVLATASDDGLLIIWKRQLEHTPGAHSSVPFGSEAAPSVENWRPVTLCRQPDGKTSEIYDLAWSPHSDFIITGSIDNIARIYNVETGVCIRQLAEHSNNVQGVAWDPLNEYVATQSNDKSVHIYSLTTRDDQYILHSQQKDTHNKEMRPHKIGKSEILRESPTSCALSPLTSNDRGRDTSIKNLGSGVRSDTFSDEKFAQVVDRKSHGSTASQTTSASSTPSDTGDPPSPSMLLSTRPFGSPVTKTTSAQSSPSTQYASLHSPSPSLNALHSTPESQEVHYSMDPPRAISIGRGHHSRNSSFSSTRRSMSPSPHSAPPLPAVRQSSVGSPASSIRMATLSYHNESLLTFFRRLSFTPDGALLLTPSGVYKSKSKDNEEEVSNTVYIYSRAGLNRGPVAHLPGLKKPSIAVSCCQVLYKLRTSRTCKSLNSDGTSTDIQEETKENTLPTFALPYRLVFAVATHDTVVVYDTQQKSPLCTAANFHDAPISDITWSPDGEILLTASRDGFCSVIQFEPGDLGEIYDGSVVELPPPVNMIHIPETPRSDSPGPKAILSHIPSVTISMTSDENEKSNKRRRIAPTLVNGP